MRRTRIAIHGSTGLMAALLALAPVASFAASGGNTYPEAQEQRDVAALHQAETLQPRPTGEAIQQTSMPVDCMDPANANATACSAR